MSSREIEQYFIVNILELNMLCHGHKLFQICIAHAYTELTKNNAKTENSPKAMPYR